MLAQLATSGSCFAGLDRAWSPCPARSASSERGRVHRCTTCLRWTAFLSRTLDTTTLFARPAFPNVLAPRAQPRWTDLARSTADRCHDGLRLGPRRRLDDGPQSTSRYRPAAPRALCRSRHQEAFGVLHE